MGSLLYSRRYHYVCGRPNRKVRPQTFKTQEAAKVYAEKHRIKNFSLENTKSPESKTAKFRIVLNVA